MKTLWMVVSMLLSSLSTFGQTKPNILWITNEDTSPQFIGCYGNKDTRTPVIDRLAREGVVLPTPSRRELCALPAAVPSLQVCGLSS